MRKMILVLLIGSVFALASCKPTEKIYPTLQVSDVSVLVDSDFDEFEGVVCDTGIELVTTQLYEITMEGEFDISRPGVYQVSYICENEYGYTDTKSRFITVFDYELASGFYDYEYLSPEARLSFLSAAEQYLMEGQIGGINLFTSATRVVFDSRFSPATEEYLPLLGFDEYRGSMYSDDTTVEFLNDYVGLAGEYTYRTYNDVTIQQYNQYIQDSSNEADILQHIYGSLYAFQLNENKSGFELLPSMAAGTPILQDSSINEYGVQVGKSWLIPVRDDLQWYFHPDVDQAFLDTNPSTSISAEDFVDTFKLSLDEQWFRAISGGGDFVSYTSAVEGVEDYYQGNGSWEDVGFKVHTLAGVEYIQIEFIQDQTEFDVMNYYSSFVYTPVHIGMYDYLESTGDWYGEDYTKIGYHGAFYVDELAPNESLHLKENPNYFDQDEYQITGILYHEFEDDQAQFDAFVDGYLDVATMPNVIGVGETSGCCDNPYLIPGPTTYRMNINGFGSTEALQEVFPDSDYVPEPILGLDAFKLAMFHAIDREYVTRDLLDETRLSSMYYFSESYMLDWTQGVTYRNTSEAWSVASEMNPSTDGFDEEKAFEYYKQAIEQLIAEGSIEAGTENDYNVIDLELITYTDSTSWDLVADYIETQFEELFVDDENYISINVDVVEKEFPQLYYDYQMMGEFDLAFGGISGMSYNLHTLRHFRSDNKSGFQLNWGIDTSAPEIEVIYVDHMGETRYERFSFDAISSILEGEVFLYQGREFDGPTAEITAVTEDSLTFTISGWDHSMVDNVIYTLQQYDYSEHKYVNVEGSIAVQVTQDEYSVIDLECFNYSFDEFGNQLYQGDYQVKIEFSYAGDTETQTTYSQWVELEPLIEETGPRVMTTTSFEVPVEVVGDSNVDEIELYEEQTDGSYLLVDTIDALGESLNWEFLEVDTEYVVKIVFENAKVFYLDFKTLEIE